MTKSELGIKARDLGGRCNQLSWTLQDELVDLRKGDEPWDRAIAMKLWDSLEPSFKEGVDLVDGVLGLGCYSHTWFELVMPPEEAHERDFRFIVDPCVPDCYPNILVISPRSPLKQLYRKISK